MAHSKDRHYWSQLRIALTAGSWGSPHPAKAANGVPITWTDLLRKFNKHCHGFTDVAEIEAFLILGTESVVADEHAVEAEVGYKVLRGLEAENTNSDVRLWPFHLLPLTFSTTSVAEACPRLLRICPQRSSSVPLLPQSSPRPCQCAEPPQSCGLTSLKHVFPSSTFGFRQHVLSIIHR